jgi:hypothetical protein
MLIALYFTKIWEKCKQQVIVASSAFGGKGTNGAQFKGGIHEDKAH